MNIYDVEAEWRARCEALADEASRGCGLSHDVYVQRFSASVDSEIRKAGGANQERLLAIAREFDYATTDQIAESVASYLDDGYCLHGLDPDCCPAGCGE